MDNCPACGGTQCSRRYMWTGTGGSHFWKWSCECRLPRILTPTSMKEIVDRYVQMEKDIHEANERMWDDMLLKKILSDRTEDKPPEVEWKIIMPPKLRPNTWYRRLSRIGTAIDETIEDLKNLFRRT